MKIMLNGEPRETSQATIAGLLEEIGITPGRVAVELNMKVISRIDHENTSLREGDAVEVVNFVGGG